MTNRRACREVRTCSVVEIYVRNVGTSLNNAKRNSHCSPVALGTGSTCQKTSQSWRHFPELFARGEIATVPTLQRWMQPSGFALAKGCADCPGGVLPNPQQMMSRKLCKVCKVNYTADPLCNNAFLYFHFTKRYKTERASLYVEQQKNKRLQRTHVWRNFFTLADRKALFFGPGMSPTQWLGPQNCSVRENLIQLHDLSSTYLYLRQPSICMILLWEEKKQMLWRSRPFSTTSIDDKTKLSSKEKTTFSGS